jgi:uncharacterized protein (DUF697 family)/GTP-binding protein EngB required for normal cell division
MSTPDEQASGTGSTAGRDLDRVGIQRLFTANLDEAFAALGCFNLAIFGKTGSGKSTLVNGIFGAPVARTGVGQPVTRGVDYHRHPDGFLGVYDSEGFETGTAGDVILDGLHALVSDHRALPIDRQIHAVWYVVRWSDRRLESRQEEFIRALDAMGLPVIGVLTQVPMREGQVHPEALEFADYVAARSLPLRPNGRMLLTNALADPFTGGEVFGLDELLEATYTVVPEVATAALTAAQIIDRERKRQAARRVIRQSVAVAAGVGATPIPFSDAALLVPTQVSMIARVTAAYGLPPGRSRALSAVASTVLTGGATMAGRYLVTNLLKVVPGGAFAGSAISGTVAGTLTRAIGGAWMAVCERALDLPEPERAAFLASPQPLELFKAVLARR